MPELTEVEFVKRSLESKSLNLIIKKVKIKDGNLRYKVDRDKISKLKGKTFIKIKRRSKFLILETEGDLIMLVHLGMTGKFFFIDKKEVKYKTSFYYDLNYQKDKKYNRIIFFLQNNQKLIYNDVRKFGFIKFYNSKKYQKIPHLKNLGPEPFDKIFNLKYFKNFITRKKRNIKNILMDQNCVSGLGNIYVNEILFKSRVRPTRKAYSLKGSEILKIIKNTKIILKKSIEHGGASIKDFSSENGKRGSFQQFFKVYGREGERCSNTDCIKTIKRVVISNRASFFCSNCQK